MATAVRKVRFIAGGPPDDDGPEPPRRLRYPCLAHGCPMPGSIFLNGHDAPGICALHHGCNPSDMPRITQILNDWQCVSGEVNLGRAALTSPDTCADVGAQNAALAAAWERMKPAVGGSDWESELQPRSGQHYGEWVRWLEVFLALRVKGMPPGTKREPTRTVRDMLTRVRQVRGNAGDAL